MPNRNVDITALSSTAVEARLRLLKMHYESRVGHIGGNLSALDLMVVLHHAVMTPDDQFVLSKGHSAGALYVILWSLGQLSDGDLMTFHKEGTHLSGHPPALHFRQIPFATGSLGHGISLASGIALAKKLRSEPGRVYCLTSDGEWNEGSCWEAVIFARQHRLNNLVIIVDANGLQGFGSTKEVADLEPLSDKMSSFGLAAQEIDGHDLHQIVEALDFQSTGPSIIIARTQKGHGVSFMQDAMEWHYLPMTEEQYRQAVQEVSKQCETAFVAL